MEKKYKKVLTANYVDGLVILTFTAKRKRISTRTRQLHASNPFARVVL